MATKPSKIRAVIRDVGTSFKEIQIKTPVAYRITRARAEHTGGSGTKATLRVRERQSSDTIDTVLEYDIGTVANPLDSLEDLLVVTTEKPDAQSQSGYTYLGVKCDSGSDNVVRVILDVEVPE